MLVYTTLQKREKLTKIIVADSCKVRVDRAPPDRTPCPSRPSALEKSIHGYVGMRSLILAWGLHSTHRVKLTTSTTCTPGNMVLELDMERLV